MSMPLMVEVDQAAENLMREAKSFGILPAGPYEVTVKKAEVEPMKGNGANAGRPMLRLQLRVIDGSPVGAGRVLFADVPLFQRWKPTAKSPEGAVASNYFNFFLAIGIPEADVAAGRLLGIEALGGMRLGVTVSKNDIDEYHKEEWNEVRAFRAPRQLEGVTEPGQSALPNAFAGGASAPTAAPVTANPWDTAHQAPLTGAPAAQAVAATSPLQAAATSGQKAW